MFANTAAGEYFLHFAASAGTAAGTFSGRLYVKQGLVGCKYFYIRHFK